MDFGGTAVTGMHVTCVAALRDYYGLEKRPIRVHEPYQMLGWIDEDLKRAMGIDVEGVLPYDTLFGYVNRNWRPWVMPRSRGPWDKLQLVSGGIRKGSGQAGSLSCPPRQAIAPETEALRPWKLQDGLEVLVPEDFRTTLDENGDTLIYPGGDTTAPPSGRMPKGGYFFDTIIRQEPLDEDRLNPEDNVEGYGPVSEEFLAYQGKAARQAVATGRAVIANFGGTSFGDIALVPGPFLKHPKGIRDVAEWYMSTRARRDYVHRVFSRQCEIGLANLERIYPVVGDAVDVVMVCGTDFGTQTSAFCSEATFRELYMPYYKQVNGWIHKNTPWKTFKHSCGAVERFMNAFIESGFDVINPVQCSAARMEPEHLKAKYGDKLVFWGGGVDTQKTLPFGTPAQVREEVLRRCEVLSRNGGFVFNAVHNVQARTPVPNIVAMIDAVREFR